MSDNYENTVGSLLSEITTFLEDLKISKLTKQEITKKSKLLEQITKVKEEYPQLNSVVESISSYSQEDELYEDLEENNKPRKGKSSPNLSESQSFNESNTIKGFLIRKSGGKIKLGFVTKLKDIIGKKYCTMESGIFSIFDNALSKKPGTTFRLHGYEVKIPSGQNNEHVFELICPGRKSYQFAAENKELLNKWISALKLEVKNDTGISSYQSSSSFSDKNGDDCEDDEVYEDTCAINETSKYSAGGTSDPEDELYDDIVTKDDPPKVSNQIKQRPPSLDNSDEIYDDIVDNTQVCNAPPLNQNAPKKIPPKPQKSIISKTASSNVSKPNIVSSKDGLPYDKMFYGKWECSGNAKDELSFKYGDILTVISQEFDNFGWWVAELNGTIGLVPRDFLTPAYELIISK